MLLLVSQVLDLEGNQVRDVEQLGYLGTCFKLSALTLESNPITKRPSYRRTVHHYIGHLQTLDDEPFSAEDEEPVCSVPAPAVASSAALRGSVCA